MHAAKICTCSSMQHADSQPAHDSAPVTKERSRVGEDPKTATRVSDRETSRITQLNQPPATTDVPLYT